MNKFFFIACMAMLAFACQVPAQTTRKYQDDVRAIQHYDRMYAPPAHPVLFTGSSSIRKWNDLERTFSDYVVMNRGIGGAVINDITWFAEELIFTYHPRQIVLYIGENDLPEAGTTADSIFSRFRVLYTRIRTKLPSVPLAYISIKPSPSRVQYIETAREANTLIRQFLAKEANTAFIDIFSLMVTKDNKPRPELFVEDMLHMNSKGYAIWRAAVAPYLLKP